MNYNNIVDKDRNKLLFVPKEYDLVIGDEFQLFYRGLIKSLNPYKYYIYVNCVKGRPYPRYFTYTPKDGEEGEYELSISLYDDFMNLIDSAKTILRVRKIEKSKKKLNILCIGDSLTCNGVWVGVGAKRFEDTITLDGDPISYGLGDNFNFIGTCERVEKYENSEKKIGYEGYGGWWWRHFVLNETVDANSAVWVEYKNHPFDENDQHSIWINNNKKWVLETIEKDKLKFKRGSGNWGITRDIVNEFKHFDGGVHQDDFTITNSWFERGNPFYFEDEKDINIKRYVEENNFGTIDFVYILLSWNGMYRPYNHDYNEHEGFMNKLIGSIRKDYPNCKVRLIGIQSTSIDGGIAASYGANGYYSDLFGDLCSCYYYNKFLSDYCEREENKSFMRYIDLKSQFDVENNMPKMEHFVNARNKTKELIGSNGVHPTLNGYNQFGDCFFRALVSDVIENNKNIK